MKIKINFFDWEIEEVTPAQDSRLWIDGSARFGVCESGTKRIFIDKNLKNDLKVAVLRHELTHTFIDAFLLDRKKSYGEEEVAEFVALYGQQICGIADLYMNTISAGGKQ